VLHAAGLLAGKRVTTHWTSIERFRQKPDITVVETVRYVRDGNVVTAAGVSAGIDMALALAARIGGASTAQAIQLGIEYDPQPPFNAGSAATAPADIVTTMTAIRDFIVYGAPGTVSESV
jgi:transcriptional regulator GlxA family with amidase domain